MENIEEIKKQTRNALKELIAEANLSEGDVIVIGCSTSEIGGGQIGKDSSLEIGRAVIDEILAVCRKHKISPAIQGCEHINRALTIEREVAIANKFEIVSVIPALHAGGALSVAAFEKMGDPVVVEHIVANAGIDIGDTEIGMHVKFVQVPLRLSEKYIGKARVTALRSRPKLIGGQRAQYE